MIPNKNYRTVVYEHYVSLLVVCYQYDGNYWLHAVNVSTGSRIWE